MKFTTTDFEERGKNFLPGHLGIKILSVDARKVSAEMQIQQFHLAPNGFLHAGSIITLADSSAGFGCHYNLPSEATGFTTIELKSNHLGTVLEGVLECTATLTHSGKTTQVWDAFVSDKKSGKKLALYRCTQMILYSK